MKLGIVIGSLVLGAVGARAAEVAPTVSQVQAQALVETGQLRLALGQEMQKLEAFEARIADLQKQIDESKETSKCK